MISFICFSAFIFSIGLFSFKTDSLHKDYRLIISNLKKERSKMISIITSSENTYILHPLLKDGREKYSILLEEGLVGINEDLPFILDSNGNCIGEGTFYID